MKRFKKRIMGLLLASVAMINLFAMPVMAMGVAPEKGYEVVTRTEVPPDAIHAGTVYRYNTPPISLGRITLVGDSKLHIYLPKNNDLDLMQGILQFRNGTQIIQKGISNIGTDYWIFDAGDVGTGIWTVTLVDAYAVGTTQKSEVWYRTLVSY